MGNLKTVVAEKLSKRVRHKNDAIQMLRGNLENSDNIVKNIIKANSRKQFFTVLGDFIKKLPLYPNQKLRDVLYNIE